jgi:MYXO-CTERM domain-containing protein
MSTNSSLERLLERVEPARREYLRRILRSTVAGTVVYTAPLITSFSMESLDGVAHAQFANQPPTPTPTTSGWGIAALIGMVSAAGAFLVRRRRRDPKP